MEQLDQQFKVILRHTQGLRPAWPACRSHFSPRSAQGMKWGWGPPCSSCRLLLSYFLPAVMAAIWLDHPCLSQFKTRVTDSELLLHNSVILLGEVSAADAQVLISKALISVFATLSLPDLCYTRNFNSKLFFLPVDCAQVPAWPMFCFHNSVSFNSCLYLTVSRDPSG